MFCKIHSKTICVSVLDKTCAFPPVGDLTNELVRHFLIETSAKGVRLKGCPNEPYFGEFTPLFS